MVEDDFSICFLGDIAASDLSIKFKLKKRIFTKNYQGLQFSKDTPDR